MLPFKLVYSDEYDLNLGAHVFQAEKFRLIHDRLLRERFAEPSDFATPQPASDEDLHLVHTPEWVSKLRQGTLTYHEIMKLEIPYSRKMVNAMCLMTGGTILAARNAVRDGFGFNIGGGFHHGFADHGEGFCALNDVAVAIRRIQSDGLVERVMVVDTDVHQGNGTASIFEGDPDVFTLSLHAEHNYPFHKERSSRDVGLPDRCEDATYLAELATALEEVTAFRPDVVFYQAGVDTLRGDRLGRMALTHEGLARRDAMVFAMVQRLGVPIVVTLGGGYGRDIEESVRAHSGVYLRLVQAFA